MNQEYRDPSFNWQKDATRIVPNSTSASETLPRVEGWGSAGT